MFITRTSVSSQSGCQALVNVVVGYWPWVNMNCGSALVFLSQCPTPSDGLSAEWNDRHLVLSSATVYFLFRRPSSVTNYNFSWFVIDSPFCGSCSFFTEVVVKLVAASKTFERLHYMRKLSI